MRTDSRRAGVSGSLRIRISDADEAYPQETTLIQQTGLLGLFAMCLDFVEGRDLAWQSGTKQSIAEIF